MPSSRPATSSGSSNGIVLVVDDDRDTGDVLRDVLVTHGFEAHVRYSGDDAVEFLKAHRVDVVLTDVQMPAMSGIDLCAHIREHYPETLPIIITGVANLELAVKAIRAGAFDFLTKPTQAEAIAIAVSRAVDHLDLKHEVQQLRMALSRTQGLEGIIGTSAAVLKMSEMICRVADSDATILISGESGTGKELVAHAIHQLSGRRDSPFVAINCAAVPANLLESELFGHVRGAFTDAKQSRRGLFVEAGRGTVFLDEIGEMPIEMQVKLLRVLQERVVRPVGSDVEHAFQARIITATNKDLELEVQERRFREDLYYRINVVAVNVPPLRARDGDVLLLAQHFLETAARRSQKPVRSFTEQAARLLKAYDWPGNVRELENCVERAVAVCRLDQITIDDLPKKLEEHERGRLQVPTGVPEELITLDQLGRRYVRHVLDAVRGNKTQAARLLGIDRRSLYRRLEPGSDASAPQSTVDVAEPDSDRDKNE